MKGRVDLVQWIGADVFSLRFRVIHSKDRVAKLTSHVILGTMSDLHTKTTPRPGGLGTSSHDIREPLVSS